MAASAGSWTCISNHISRNLQNLETKMEEMSSGISCCHVARVAVSVDICWYNGTRCVTQWKRCLGYYGILWGAFRMQCLQVGSRCYWFFAQHFARGSQAGARICLKMFHKKRWRPHTLPDCFPRTSGDRRWSAFEQRAQAGILQSRADSLKELGRHSCNLCGYLAWTCSHQRILRDLWSLMIFVCPCAAIDGSGSWSCRICCAQLVAPPPLTAMAGAMATGSGGRASMVDQMVVHEKLEVKRGGSLLQQNEHFVENRTCRDVIWAIIFLILAACIAIGTIWTIIMVYSFENVEEAKDHKMFLKTHENTFIYGLMSILAAGLASAFFSIAFLQFTKRNTECVVWTSLILGPMCCIIAGAYIMTQSWLLPGIWGAVLVLLGGCLLACVICCYKDLVPMTVLLLRTVIHVVELHPSIMILSVISALLAAAWSLACITCLLGSVIVDEDMMVLIKSRASNSPGKAHVNMVLWGKAFHFLPVHVLPVVPHKAVAEVSKIGNL